MLAGYVVYQFVRSDRENDRFFNKINILFIATSLANVLWIFAWHYDYIGVSVIIMAALLILLIKIADLLRTKQFTGLEKLFISAPFHIYFGWITVAAIANVTVFLVSMGWTGFGIADFIWTSIILLVGALIGILRMRKDRSVIYGFVLIWAYIGILIKHISASGFDGQYPSIIATVVLCLVLFGFFVGRIIYKK